MSDINKQLKEIRQLLIDFSYPYKEVFKLLDGLIEPECSFKEGDLVAVNNKDTDTRIRQFIAKENDTFLAINVFDGGKISWENCQHAIVFQDYTGKPDIGGAKGSTLKLADGSTISIPADRMRYLEWDNSKLENKIIAWAPWVDRGKS